MFPTCGLLSEIEMTHARVSPNLFVTVVTCLTCCVYSPCCSSRLRASVPMLEQTHILPRSILLCLITKQARQGLVMTPKQRQLFQLLGATASLALFFFSFPVLGCSLAADEVDDRLPLSKRDSRISMKERSREAKDQVVLRPGILTPKDCLRLVER